MTAWQYRHVVSINTSVACTRPWHWQWGQVSDHEIAPVSRTQHLTSHAQNKIFDCSSSSWQSIVSLRPDADNKQSLHAACSAATTLQWIMQILTIKSRLTIFSGTCSNKLILPGNSSYVLWMRIWWLEPKILFMQSESNSSWLQWIERKYSCWQGWNQWYATFIQLMYDAWELLDSIRNYFNLVWQ